MAPITYTHQAVPPLVRVLFCVIYGAVKKQLGRLVATCRPDRPAGRVLIVAAILITLALQIILLVILAELIDVCISLFELYVELAHKHLEITL